MTDSAQLAVLTSVHVANTVQQKSFWQELCRVQECDSTAHWCSEHTNQTVASYKSAAVFSKTKVHSIDSLPLKHFHIIQSELSSHSGEKPSPHTASCTSPGILGPDTKSQIWIWFCVKWNVWMCQSSLCQQCMDGWTTQSVKSFEWWWRTSPFTIHRWLTLKPYTP